MVERVDEQDHTVGVVDRGEAIRRRWLHRVATTVCRDPDGRILVHRRPDHVPRFPGQYNWLVGGAVGVGETYPAAASRELAEELGVCTPTRFLFKYLCRGVISPYWLGLHEAVLNQPVVPDASEVAWHDWLPPVELRAAMYDMTFVPDAREAFDRYLAEEAGPRGSVPRRRRSHGAWNAHADRSQLGLCRRRLL
ncbi:NUDIX domain-containing protein [Streptomyces sp. NPDC097610]|uniref:NUDIX hydrolase n=1 Tax=Streptomyces sp. NPDC097610 TaxID=3157227 RepID=UPI00332E7A0A